MNRINLLSEDTANKIAAGEVVERPCSVVKELVENSIDAHAKNITIEIEQGGTSLIKIIDDGDGIYKDDINKAFMPHATSKIKESSDIYNINTLGFRGEALPSIAAVSKVSLKSKTDSSEEGYEINIEGGKASDVVQCGINKGTFIEVTDIFFNVPARKKFLKTVSKEGSLITDIITRLALSNPDISFKLLNNSKKALQTFGTGNIKDVIRTIYGKSISENLLYFEDISDTVTIYGYVGKESIARGSRNNQSIFVNKRYVKNKSLTVAVEQAFKSFSTVNKFPFFILYIEIYPELIDVNIHPTKAEIKFDDERMMFSRVFNAVHTALKKDVFEEFAEKNNIEEEQKQGPSFEEISFKIQNEEEAVKAAYNSVQIAKADGRIINNGLVNDCVKKEEISIPVSLHPEESRFLRNDKTDTYKTIDNVTEIPNTTFYEKTNESYSSSLSNIEIRDSVILNNSIDAKKIEIEHKTAKFPALKIIGQYNKTYILGEYDGTLYMIDQHAAHEKILFEKYLKNIEEGSIVVQPLFVPIILELSNDDYAYYEENTDIFKSSGFTLEEFGGTSVSLKEVPYFLGKLDPKKLFLEILDNLRNLGSGKTSDVKHNAIATKACKAAVKGNDSLDVNEMISLVEELRYIDDPFHCPHGRPVIIKFTNTDIEKKFKRIV